MDGKTRLLKILHKAERIEFTDKDKLVFFSDVHRGNNSWADEFAQNETIYTHAIRYYYKRGFTYVEVGDGDELLKFKYVEPIRIAHEGVYRILQKYNKKDRLHYIYGNHDYEYSRPEMVHKRLNSIFNPATEETEILFDDFKAHEALVFIHKESGVEFFTVHGHQWDTLFHRMIWLNGFLLRTFWRPLQLLGLQDPGSVAQDIVSHRKVENRLYEWSAEHNQPMIAGHTHRPRFPKKNEAPYFNTGGCVHPRWITCIEIAEGEIALVRWDIKVDKKGHLIVEKTYQKGPKPIQRFAQP